MELEEKESKKKEITSIAAGREMGRKRGRGGKSEDCA